MRRRDRRKIRLHRQDGRGGDTAAVPYCRAFLARIGSSVGWRQSWLYQQNRKIYLGPNMKTTTRDIARSGNVYLIPLLQTFRRIDAGYCRPFSHLSLLSTGTSLDVAPATRP